LRAFLIDVELDNLNVSGFTKRHMAITFFSKLAS